MAIYAMSDIHGMYGPFMRRIKQLNNLGSFKTGEDTMVLLGDYVDVGLNSFKVVRTIYELQKDIGKNLIVLMGNHDKWFIDFIDGKDPGWISIDSAWLTFEGFMPDNDISVLKGMLKHSKMGTGRLAKASDFCRKSIMSEHGDIIRWMKSLPLYYETDSQIFVHAGIDEEAEDLWAVGTSDDIFISKYPATKGSFYKDIVAGHVSVSSLKKDLDFHDIYWDGKSHYYIDGIDSYKRTVRDDDRVIPVLVYKNSPEGSGYFSLSEDNSLRIITK